ncbi:MAG: DUF4166 domain-containing protein [Micavibrio sp.]|nr:DUF4166 domain-containing protein [Micavibrio sp.]
MNSPPLKVAKKCVDIFIGLLVTYLKSIFIVCVFFAVIVALLGGFAQAGALVVFAPIMSIMFSIKSLLIVGYPAALALYFFKIKQKLWWVLVGGITAQVAYFLFMHPLLASEEGINLLLAMPAMIGMLTGFMLQKRLFNDMPLIKEGYNPVSKENPTFKSIFGDSWDELPPVMKAHYANRPYSDDETVAEGALDVMCKSPLSWLAPIMKLLGQIPPANETGVPVSVQFKSDKDSKAFHFVRTFNFKQNKPYVFHSRMVQIKGNEVIEIMRFGLSWRLLYSWDGEKVVLAHKGYALLAFGHFIPLPLTLLMGKGYAEEIAVDDKTFDMVTHITHPWWGKVYEYKGRFEVMG